MKFFIETKPFDGGTKRLPQGAAKVSFTKKEDIDLVIKGGVKELLISTGSKRLEERKFSLLSRRIIQSTKTKKIKEIHLSFESLFQKCSGASREWCAETFVVNALMANFEFTKYKTEKKGNFVQKVILYTNGAKDVEKAVRRGEVVGGEVNACRALSNTPGGEMTPRKLSAAAKDAVARTRIRVRVLGKKAMTALGMGALLGVAQGSKEEPQLIILLYKGGGVEKPIVLVGKGVTFDTGGLNLKPTNAIVDMHLDMSGGAAVIYAITSAAKLKCKKNIIGLIPAVENMPSGSSYRPGDILRSLSGKTIEILNTDAEGRVILADALTYARRFSPRLVVSVATLTGAAMSALGQRASALFTNEDSLAQKMIRLGEESGDYLWPLPLWEEYEKEIKGNFGDIANIGKTQYGGAITAAIFLYQFAKKFPSWAHLDIAPRMIATDDEFLAKGAVGAPVRLLLKLLEEY